MDIFVCICAGIGELQIYVNFSELSSEGQLLILLNPLPFMIAVFKKTTRNFSRSTNKFMIK